MGTVSKALGLLGILAHPESRHGLTEIARLSGHDKATTRRLLVELKANGFVEQIEGTREYVLGPALLTLGRAREERFPFFRIAQPVVRALAEATGETAHASEYGAGSLNSVCTQQSARSSRVIVKVGEKLPLHATASGVAVLAASPDALVETILRAPLQKFATNTLTDSAAVWRLVAQARAAGFSQCHHLREDGVHSVAAAIRNPHGAPVGAIAVAMPTARATPESLARYGEMTVSAAQDISARLFGPETSVRRTA